MNAAQTEAILFGAQGVAGNLAERRGLYIVCDDGIRMSRGAWRNSSKKPDGTISTHRSAAARQRAAQGELTILASGSKAAFAKARTALDAMSAKLYELGDEPPGRARRSR